MTELQRRSSLQLQVPLWRSRDRHHHQRKLLLPASAERAIFSHGTSRRKVKPTRRPRTRNDITKPIDDNPGSSKKTIDDSSSISSAITPRTEFHPDGHPKETQLIYPNPQSTTSSPTEEEPPLSQLPSRGPRKK